MDQDRRGLWYGVAAYTTWGVAPIFWKWLGGVPAIQQAAHRVVWSVPVLLVAVIVLKRLPRLRAALSRPRTVLIAAAAAVLLVCNWSTYVWAIATEQIVESSLGYFINPLFTVALGVVLLGERLRPAGVVAVLLAFTGVAYMTIRLGELPWISLALAGTFGLYGLLKKRAEAAPPLEGLLGETSIAMVPALAFIIVLAVRGEGSFGTGWGDTLLLVAAGAVTAAPLLMFGAAAQRIPLSTVGLLQYLAPTLQFLLGVAVYEEPVVADQLVGFVFVWVALVIFTVDNLRAGRAGPAPAA
jgi:chloramphenicol-sensitive protein RarD